MFIHNIRPLRFPFVILNKHVVQQYFCKLGVLQKPVYFHLMDTYIQLILYVHNFSPRIEF